MQTVVGRDPRWYGMVWYGMVWYGMVWLGMVWYGMVWYGMAWHGMVWYGMEWYGMAWQKVVAGHWGRRGVERRRTIRTNMLTQFAQMKPTLPNMEVRPELKSFIKCIN